MLCSKVKLKGIGKYASPCLRQFLLGNKKNANVSEPCFIQKLLINMNSFLGIPNAIRCINVSPNWIIDFSKVYE
jgi:hypothetical protein